MSDNIIKNIEAGQIAIPYSVITMISNCYKEKIESFIKLLNSNKIATIRDLFHKNNFNEQIFIRSKFVNDKLDEATALYLDQNTKSLFFVTPYGSIKLTKTKTKQGVGQIEDALDALSLPKDGNVYYFLNEDCNNQALDIHIKLDDIGTSYIEDSAKNADWANNMQIMGHSIRGNMHVNGTLSLPDTVFNISADALNNLTKYTASWNNSQTDLLVPAMAGVAAGAIIGNLRRNNEEGDYHENEENDAPEAPAGYLSYIYKYPFITGAVGIYTVFVISNAARILYCHFKTCPENNPARIAALTANIVLNPENPQMHPDVARYQNDQLETPPIVPGIPTTSGAGSNQGRVATANSASLQSSSSSSSGSGHGPSSRASAAARNSNGARANGMLSTPPTTRSPNQVHSGDGAPFTIGHFGDSYNSPSFSPASSSSLSPVPSASSSDSSANQNERTARFSDDVSIDLHDANLTVNHIDQASHEVLVASISKSLSKQQTSGTEQALGRAEIEAAIKLLRKISVSLSSKGGHDLRASTLAAAARIMTEDEVQDMDSNMLKTAKKIVRIVLPQNVEDDHTVTNLFKKTPAKTPARIAQKRKATHIESDDDEEVESLMIVESSARKSTTKAKYKNGRDSIKGKSAASTSVAMEIDSQEVLPREAGQKRGRSSVAKASPKLALISLGEFTALPDEVYPFTTDDQRNILVEIEKNGNAAKKNVNALCKKYQFDRTKIDQILALPANVRFNLWKLFVKDNFDEKTPVEAVQSNDADPAALKAMIATFTAAGLISGASATFIDDYSAFYRPMGGLGLKAIASLALSNKTNIINATETAEIDYVVSDEERKLYQQEKIDEPEINPSERLKLFEEAKPASDTKQNTKQLADISIIASSLSQGGSSVFIHTVLIVYDYAWDVFVLTREIPSLEQLNQDAIVVAKLGVHEAVSSVLAPVVDYAGACIGLPAGLGNAVAQSLYYGGAYNILDILG